MGTLFDNGTVIQQGQDIESGAAGGGLSATANNWDDYELQTDHYVVAYFVYGDYYENPLYYQEGSCDDSGDCTIGPGGGVYYVVEANIYLGSTIADQTNVPQDASAIGLASDSAFDQFLASAPQPVPSGVMFTKDAWEKAIRDVAAQIFLARGVYATQNPSNPYIYPLPYLVELIDDTQTSPGGNNLPERDRTYILKDSYGRPWSRANPVSISEIFSFIGGSKSVMPAPNNPTNPNYTPWTSPFTDMYGFQFIGQPKVWYWQMYYASGFEAPGFPSLPIPGVTGLPNISGPIIPLMIVSKDLSHLPNCMYYGIQGILLSPPTDATAGYVGINSDTGPENPPGCSAFLQ